jgi:phage tail sheath protein FI
MTQPAYGLTINRQNDGPRPAQPSDMSIIGIVLPSDDADVQFLPLNTPVTFDSGDAVALARIGTGALAVAVAMIDSQLADLQTSARIVAVRVARDMTGAGGTENVDGTIANIIGSQSAGTGIYALLNSGTTLGIIPRVIIAPGYTAATVTFTSSLGGVVPTGHISTFVGGAPAAIIMDTPGDMPFGSVVAATIAGTGTGATVTVTTQLLQNPICAALPQVLNALLGHAIVDSYGDGLVSANNWRQTMSDPRLIPADAWAIIASGAGTAYAGGSAIAAGLFARVDFLHEGIPGWSISGQPVAGILGLKNVYPFSLLDGATAGQQLLANQISIIERGEIGVEVAAIGSGFIWLGVWNASTDPLKWFYNKNRMRDWTHLALIKAIRFRLGVENVTPQGVQDVLNDMNVVGSFLIQKKAIIGFKIGFEAARNSTAQLRQGKFVVSYSQEEPAPITGVTVDSRNFETALEVELANLVAQAAAIPAQYLA